MEVQVAPLRAWDDFFPGSDRFALPDLKDISKWNNRVVSNLLYYQTNYLMVAAALVSIVGSVGGLGAAGQGWGRAGLGGPGRAGLGLGRAGGSAPRVGALRPGPGPRERAQPGCESTGAGELPFPFLLFPFPPLTLFHSPFLFPPLLKPLVSIKNAEAWFPACLGGDSVSASAVPEAEAADTAPGRKQRCSECGMSLLKKTEPHPAQRSVLPPEPARRGCSA